MKLLFFCPRWGSESLSWVVFIKKVKDAGYQGIEWGLHSGTPDKEIDEAFDLLVKNGLHIILQHWDTVDPNFEEHRDKYASWLARVRTLPAYKINSQTGKDYFTQDQNISLIKIATDHTEKTGVPVVHETHRGKSLFAAHIAKEYFNQLPDLRITLDISHWVTVAESFLKDQQEIVQTAFARADHLHARIGHTQGPQVTDPRLSQWKEERDIFFTWWDQVIQMKKEDSQMEFSITPEFGPIPYMTLFPTGEPMCNQWQVNEYIMNEFKKRYL